MTIVDVIIPVNSIDEYVRAFTQGSIDSLRASQPDNVRFNIVICEQNLDAQDYESVDRTVKYHFPFNYNRVMNFGANYCNAEYIMFCNNDLFYLKNFITPMLEVMRCGYSSLSPTDPTKDLYSNKQISEGYGVEKDLKGYCIMCKRKMFDSIGGFDERLDFWYSDHLYKDQLIANRVKHARVTNAYVIHFHHSTLKKMSKTTQDKFTNGERDRYKNLPKR